MSLELSQHNSKAGSDKLICMYMKNPRVATKNKNKKIQ